METELVFSINGSRVSPATTVPLVETGLEERAHLEQWVLDQPQILGDDVMIVTFEFDRWTQLEDLPGATGFTAGEIGAGVQRAATRRPRPVDHDRLAVLGLDRTGHLVVAEFKGGKAPDTTISQAVRYAAMVSRFTPEDLAEEQASFLRGRGERISVEDTADRLSKHVDGELTADTLSKPRIVLLAAEFPPQVTATVVWLTEMGLDIVLHRFQAYQAGNQGVLTVSQLYPTRDVKEFTVAPWKQAARDEPPEAPEMEWTVDDLNRLRGMTLSPTVLALMRLTTERPDDWVGFTELIDEADRMPEQARAELAVFTMLVKRRFGRRNWPLDLKWDSEYDQMYYRASPQVAERWQQADVVESAGDL